MSRPEPEEEIALPEALQERLADYSSQRVLVPTAVDRKVLHLAKEHLRTRSRPVFIHRRVWWAAAAAILVLLLVWSLSTGRQGRQPADNSAVLAGKLGDLDGNGKVDIFDAFALARALQQKTVSKDWDVNRDGVVDQRDVGVIARRAVQLENAL